VPAALTARTNTEPTIPVPCASKTRGRGQRLHPQGHAQTSSCTLWVSQSKLFDWIANTCSDWTWGGRSALAECSWMEDWMPRHFGLKATLAAAPSASAASSIATSDQTASASVSKSLSLASSPASRLSAQCSELPYSPASWRGCLGRRSISAN